MASARCTLAVILGPLTVAFGLYAGAVQLGAAYKATCARSGPTPPGAIVSESSDRVTEQRSFWPLGAVCDWRRADGNGTIRSYHGDFALSAATYAGVGGGVALTVVGARRPRGG